jgi:hypothetical protein
MVPAAEVGLEVSRTLSLVRERAENVSFSLVRRG